MVDASRVDQYRVPRRILRLFLSKRRNVCEQSRAMLDTRLPITKQTPRDVVQNRHGGAPFAHDGSYELPLAKPRLDRSGPCWPLWRQLRVLREPRARRSEVNGQNRAELGPRGGAAVHARGPEQRLC